MSKNTGKAVQERVAPAAVLNRIASGEHLITPEQATELTAEQATAIKGEMFGRLAAVGAVDARTSYDLEVFVYGLKSRDLIDSSLDEDGPDAWRRTGKSLAEALGNAKQGRPYSVGYIPKLANLGRASVVWGVGEQGEMRRFLANKIQDKRVASVIKGEPSEKAWQWLENAAAAYATNDRDRLAAALDMPVNPEDAIRVEEERQQQQEQEPDAEAGNGRGEPSVGEPADKALTALADALQDADADTVAAVADRVKGILDVAAKRTGAKIA